MADVESGEGVAEPTTYNLLFVCTGNTCRSPMAEAIARREIERRGWTHVAARSAGVAAAPDLPAAESAVAVAAEHGLDLAEHRSRPLTPELVEWADLILGMGPSHLGALAGVGASDRLALITDFLPGDLAGQPIEDPYGGDVDGYRRAFDQLEPAVSSVLDRLEPILSP